MKPILEATSVSKHYGVFKALQDVTLPFYENEIVAIVMLKKDRDGQRLFLDQRRKYVPSHRSLGTLPLGY